MENKAVCKSDCEKIIVALATSVQKISDGAFTVFTSIKAVAPINDIAHRLSTRTKPTGFNGDDRWRLLISNSLLKFVILSGIQRRKLFSASSIAID